MQRSARGLALISAALALGACKDKDASGTRTKPAGDWRPSCERALAGLDEVAPELRAKAILEGCPVCDPGPLLLEREGLKRTAEYTPELDAAVQRCGGYCTKLARTDFLRMIQHQLDTKEPSARPWRQLAEACPAELGWRDASRGFAGATWFLLERTAKIAGAELAAPMAAAANASFPLPPVAPEGRGVGLPSPASGARALPGRLVLTVLAEGAMVGRLPWARLAAAGVIVDGDYPGAAAKDDELVAALAAAEVTLQEAAVVASGVGGAAGAAALDASSITLAAPVALPARRLVEILRQIKRPARLAVRAPTGLPEYALAMTLPPSLVAAPIAGAAELALDDTAALTAASGKSAPITLRLAAESTVDELAAALATLGAAPTVALLTPAPNPTPTPPPPSPSPAAPSAAKP